MVKSHFTVHGESISLIRSYHVLNALVSLITLLLCTEAWECFPFPRYTIPRLFIPQLWWFCAWEICSFTPSNSTWLNIELLWCVYYLHAPLVIRVALMADLCPRSKTMDSAPLFKFLYLIWGPTALWVQAAVTTNPPKTSTMTFGQARNLDISLTSVTLINAHI